MKKWELNVKLINLDNVLNKYSKFHILQEIPINLYSLMPFLKEKKMRMKEEMKKNLGVYLLKSIPLRMYNHQDYFLKENLKSRLLLVWESRVKLN